jgi:hypothetical protein
MGLMVLFVVVAMSVLVCLYHQSLIRSFKLPDCQQHRWHCFFVAFVQSCGGTNPWGVSRLARNNKQTNKLSDPSNSAGQRVDVMLPEESEYCSVVTSGGTMSVPGSC